MAGRQRCGCCAGRKLRGVCEGATYKRETTPFRCRSRLSCSCESVSYFRISSRCHVSRFFFWPGLVVPIYVRRPSGTSPNGAALLARTLTDYQACMLRSLQATVSELLNPSTPDARGVSPPQLIVVDRFTFAGMDVAKQFNINYVVNNPHLLLDLDSPSWSLPRAISAAVPAAPPLSLSVRAANLMHRLHYSAAMLRAFFSGQPHQFVVIRLSSALESWSDYFASPLIVSNTIWGVELHRSADSQGIAFAS